MNKLDFAGRNAIVTGGAQGIGLAIVQRLLASGAKVRIWDRDQKLLDQTLARLGAAASGEAVDVTDHAAIERAAAAAHKALGKIDVLVNNAGIAGPTGKVEDIKPEDWDRTIAIDLNGMFYVTRRFMPMIKEAGGGSIINLSSIAGRFGFPMRTPYSAAKWAVVGFTQSLAAEAGPDKVRVNCIQPGIVEGDRIDRVIEAKAKSLGVPQEEVRNRMLAGTSLNTTVTAQDIANMALFLATAPGRHISGQDIAVCGGSRYLV